MEDPSLPPDRAVYTRISAGPDDRSDSPQDDSSWSGLFTRPANLALRDEVARGLPLRALNRACLMLLGKAGSRIGGSTEDDAGAGDTRRSFIEAVALDCGFRNRQDFDTLFFQATGWYPEDWQSRYGRV